MEQAAEAVAAETIYVVTIWTTRGAPLHCVNGAGAPQNHVLPPIPDEKGKTRVEPVLRSDAKRRAR
jgi:hypothetical protein